MRDVEVTVSSGELQMKALVRPNIASASANRLFRYCFSGVLLVFAVCLIVAIKVLTLFSGLHVPFILILSVFTGSGKIILVG